MRHSTADQTAFWPPLRERLHLTIIEIISLHNLPKRGEQRPRYAGRHAACHNYHRELSGFATPPDNGEPSHPRVTLSLHPIGGFCALCRRLPLQVQRLVETELTVRGAESDGLCTSIQKKVNCLAAEPHATFLRISVTDGAQQEVAYETVVLGRLRHGYRIFQLRSQLGTRIELCYLFVRVTFGSESNNFAAPRQQQHQVGALRQRLKALEAVVVRSMSVYGNIESLKEGADDSLSRGLTEDSHAAAPDAGSSHPEVSGMST